MQENQVVENAVSVIEKREIVKVMSVQDRTGALEICKKIKEQKNAVVSHFADIKSKAHSAWKAIVAKEKSYTDRLDAVERKIKSAVLVYDRAQEEIRRAEQRRLQAEADERARRERERLEKEAARLKTPELKEERLAQAQAIVAPVVEVAQIAPKVEGVSTRKTWKARVIDAGQVPREFMTVNETALNAYARATKGKMPVAGVEFYEEESLSVR
jgi:hypothetical protein